MPRIIRLRYRLYMMILPLVFVVVLLSGVMASMESRAALTELANRHLAYKAEQLRDYTYNEWRVITELELADQEKYQQAAQESFRSYALSLLRTNNELIVVYDHEGQLVMRIGLNEAGGSRPIADNGSDPVELSTGWFEKELLGEHRVGVVFQLEPFQWQVAVTDLHSTFFSEIQNIRSIHIWILFITTVVLILFISLFIGHVTRPLERLRITIDNISSNKDLSQRAQIEFADEIGILAYRFNRMVAALEQNYEKLKKTHKAEQLARRTAVSREEEALYLLGRVSDFRDEETGEHLKRIGELSALFAKLLGLSREQQDLIYRSSPLHDIGKVGISDAILLKPGKLTPEEFEKMKQHTVLGYQLLKDAESKYLVEGARIALTHHEKWDGSGYPEGLSGEDIPLAGRIVSIVDVFDALTSQRPYKDAWSFDETLKFIVGERGKHFDPTLTDLFEANSDKFLAILHK